MKKKNQPGEKTVKRAAQKHSVPAPKPEDLDIKSDERMKNRLKLELAEILEIVNQEPSLKFLENSIKEKEDNSDVQTLLSYYRIVSQTLLDELKKKPVHSQTMVPSIQSMMSESETNQLRREAQEKTKTANEYALLLEKMKADFEAFRQRINHQQQSIQESANEKLIIKLLPILDNFAYALKHPVSEANCQDFVRGVQMMYSHVEDLFKSEGVVPIKVTPGQKFDPSCHEAIMEEKEESGEEGVIKEEIQRGYSFKNKVIRPAKVKVSVA